MFNPYPDQVAPAAELYGRLLRARGRDHDTERMERWAAGLRAQGHEWIDPATMRPPASG